MDDYPSDFADITRHYQTRSYRQRRLYWLLGIPIVLACGIGSYFGVVTETLIGASVVVLILLLGKLHELSDILRYLGSQQREAALARHATFQQVNEIKHRFDETTDP